MNHVDAATRAASGTGPVKPFWRTHLVLVLVLFVLALAAIKVLHLDFRVAGAFFDPEAGVFPARDVHWAKAVLHDGGNRLISVVAVGAFAVFLSGLVTTRTRHLRRAALYLALCVAVTAGVAAIGKQLTNMDCPWSLERYGGDRPYVGLFSVRPESLPRAACFPGAHSAGAFALFAFYFIWRESRPRRARMALLGAVILGTAYAATQWARGAHFVSHDLWSALLAWLVCLGIYVAFGRRLTR